ncbi:hypothetical protein Tco_0967565 [Tanacetum coccineum]
MQAYESFVCLPMVMIVDVSVNSKPFITELYAVNDEAVMVDKKYVNVTDLNLVSDEKVSISDRDDLEKICKTIAVLLLCCLKGGWIIIVDVNTDEAVADEDVDIAGNNVFVAE